MKFEEMLQDVINLMIAENSVGYEKGKQETLKQVQDKCESFKNKINRFGFRTDNRANILIRKQVLEIFDEELNKKLEKL